MNKIGQVTACEIVQSNKKARISGGMYITFQTTEDVNTNSMVYISYEDGVRHHFGVEITKAIDKNTLLIEAVEMGYFAKCVNHKGNCDVRTVIGLDVFLVTDEATIASVKQANLWC